MIYYLGLGSNLGNRYRNLKRARELLREKGKILKCSKIYQTRPFQMNSKRLFANQVVEYQSVLSPLDLLIFLKQIEQKMGRDANQGHNCDRIIDLDILFAEDLVMKREELEIPHPGIGERDFVLRPLSEIAPALVHPVLKKTVLEMLTELNNADSSLRRDKKFF